MADLKGQASSPDGARQWALYTILVEEYRFQVSLNWQRSQYLLALNLGLLGAGTGLLGITSSTARTLTSALFLVGAFVAVASIRVVTLQHEYYRSTRSRKVRLEEELDVTGSAPRPTAGMRGEARGPKFSPSSWSVTDVIRILFGLLAIIDLGAASAAFESLDSL
jgi:hypothetical protein